ncbi:2-keto-3-deoxygluconate permease [Desulfosporosinus sp. SB140]|uniref:2-keto-3-deoxygluconate permease n=1 Tax=Desulfosporosinus paludis TaxID=3115649 RepID=UPI00388FA5FD
MQIPIKRTLERVPGGMMLIPLLLGAIIKTWFPSVIKLPSFTGGLMTGAIPILAVFFFCMGANISLKAAPKAVARGGAFLVTKILLATGVGIFIAHFTSSGIILGISALAFIAAMNDTNAGMYCALMSEYGSSEDVGAYSLQSLESGPFFTMVALGASGLAKIPVTDLIAAIGPMVLGFIAGNLDHELRDFLYSASKPLIPFFAFALGCGIDFHNIINAGPSGLLLGLFTLIITGGGLFIVDRFFKGTGVAGVAAATTAGNAVATPLAVAMADPSFKAIQATATAQVAASVIVTAILVPIVTATLAKYKGKDNTAAMTQATAK